METERKPNSHIYFPKTLKILKQVGEQIRLARLRRKISVELACKRANISRTTLWKVENGDPTVAIGIYARVLNAIGLQDDLAAIARDDTLGKILQDQELSSKWRSGDD